MSLPTFLIVGAAKSGTTSVAQYLKQHPEVLVPVNKEPNYFAFRGEALSPLGPVPSKILYAIWYSHCVTDYADYLALFKRQPKHKAVGEASVRYLYFPDAPHRIKETIPDVRLIVILREPVSRLYSHYCMNVQYQLEPLSLPEAIQAEESRRAANWGWDWHYVNAGLYAQQLKRYFELFPREQIKVFLYDEFVEKPLAVFQEICRHIGVDDQFVPDMSERGMVSRRPRNLTLARLLYWPVDARSGWERLIRHPQRLPGILLSLVERWNSQPIPRLDAALRDNLSASFREDVKELEELLGRKVPWYT
jgi:hypothetical protein